MKGFAKMIWEFAEALKKHGNDGFKNVTVTEYAERMSICTSCKHFTKTHACGLCGCHMPVKARWRSSICPDNPPKWVNKQNGERKEGADTDNSDGV